MPLSAPKQTHARIDYLRQVERLVDKMALIMLKFRLKNLQTTRWWLAFLVILAGLVLLGRLGILGVLGILVGLDELGVLGVLGGLAELTELGVPGFLGELAELSVLI